MNTARTAQFIVRAEPQKKNFSVKLDVAAFERMAANFGMFNPDFLKSVDQAEREYRGGKVRRVRSLGEIE
jgi:hypothetical protein